MAWTPPIIDVMCNEYVPVEKLDLPLEVGPLKTTEEKAYDQMFTWLSQRVNTPLSNICQHMLSGIEVVDFKSNKTTATIVLDHSYQCGKAVFIPKKIEMQGHDNVLYFPSNVPGCRVATGPWGKKYGISGYTEKVTYDKDKDSFISIAKARGWFGGTLVDKQEFDREKAYLYWAHLDKKPISAKPKLIGRITSLWNETKRAFRFNPLTAN